MEKIKKPLIFLIVLVILLLLLVILYLLIREGNYFPYTEISLKNTTIVGEVIG